MKRTMVSLALLVSMGMSGILPTYAGGGIEGMADMAYQPYVGNFSLETMLSAAESSSVKRILSSHADEILQNTVQEDWEYNNAHMYEKQFLLHYTVPSDLQKRVLQKSLVISQGDSPIVYDAKEDIAGGIIVTGAPMSDATYTDETIMVTREEILSHLGNTPSGSYTTQLYLTLSDGSMIPFSQISYGYINTDEDQSKKETLSNMYYAQSEEYNYPNVDRVVEKGFSKLQSSSTSIEQYKALLEKVLEKCDTYIAGYEKETEQIVSHITDDSQFPEYVSAYGTIMMQQNILQDVRYRVQSEIATLNYSDVLTDIFNVVPDETIRP